MRTLKTYNFALKVSPPLASSHRGQHKRNILDSPECGQARWAGIARGVAAGTHRDCLLNGVSGLTRRTWVWRERCRDDDT